MCLRFEDHCRKTEPTTLLPYGSDESTEVHGKWTDNVLVFYGYDVNCKRSIHITGVLGKVFESAAADK